MDASCKFPRSGNWRGVVGIKFPASGNLLRKPLDLCGDSGFPGSGNLEGGSGDKVPRIGELGGGGWGKSSPHRGTWSSRQRSTTPGLGFRV